MKHETSGKDNIAGPAFNRAGAAGRDHLPALIGRIIAVGALVASVAVVRVNHSKAASEVGKAFQGRNDIQATSIRHPYDIQATSNDVAWANSPSAGGAVKGGC
jgi:hypothetical protein